MSEVLGDNARTSSALRGFLRRSGFGVAGATRRTLRLYYATLDQLDAAAAEFARRPIGGDGQRIVDRFAAIETSGVVSPLVRSAEPGEADIDLEVCFHVPPTGGDPWPGIERMLRDLGGVSPRRWTGIQSLGYGSVRIDRERAVDVVRHPLVRHVGPVPRIVMHQPA